MNKSIVVATGHRPQFCPCKFDRDHEWLLNLKRSLKQKLLTVRPEHVIVGGAIGWDTWVAEVALACKIPIHLYIPFEGQGKNWHKNDKKRYDEIRSKADKEVIVCDKYSKYAFLKRDEAMVDNGDIVFALWNPSIKKGGTYHTVSYAKKKKLPITNFWT